METEKSLHPQLEAQNKLSNRMPRKWLGVFFSGKITCFHELLQRIEEASLMSNCFAFLCLRILVKEI